MKNFPLDFIAYTENKLGFPEECSYVEKKSHCTEIDGL